MTSHPANTFRIDAGRAFFKYADTDFIRARLFNAPGIFLWSDIGCRQPIQSVRPIKMSR
ncbi:hypothetical protein DSCOOX_64220 [Desulfosarcina ovata subsp. ovata]|uniref:Uncharacterized protein n=1 Tax=Desulfosarcina ovata subsp. ovata TaxID=2752305 RepID=A0A5K8AKK4_9BACT|nr:hypothetical protein DSCOOX_64220 [Desulfosarcina ovata subsp. ovata]